MKGRFTGVAGHCTCLSRTPDHRQRDQSRKSIIVLDSFSEPLRSSNVRTIEKTIENVVSPVSSLSQTAFFSAPNRHPLHALQHSRLYCPRNRTWHLNNPNSLFSVGRLLGGSFRSRSLPLLLAGWAWRRHKIWSVSLLPIPNDSIM